MNVMHRVTRNEEWNHEPLRLTCSAVRVAVGMLALAAITVGTAIAQPPPSDTSSAPPLLYPYAIAAVDVDAVTLGDQPNMHGIGAMAGADGHPHLFCVDPSDHDPALFLRQQIQSGADNVRYE